MLARGDTVSAIGTALLLDDRKIDEFFELQKVRLWATETLHGIVLGLKTEFTPITA